MTTSSFHPNNLLSILAGLMILVLLSLLRSSEVWSAIYPRVREDDSKESLRKPATTALERFAFQLEQNHSFNVLPMSSNWNNSLTASLHYRISPFKVSPGQSLVHELGTFRNLANESISWDDEGACFERIHCSISHAMSYHFPHFAQSAFPCWSLFQEFPERGILQIPKNFSSLWINGLLEAFQKSGVSIVVNGAKPNATNCDWESVFTGQPSGFPAYNEDGTAPVPFMRYFHSREDMVTLQKHVLDDEFRNTSSVDDQGLNVLFYSRKGSERHWIEAERTKADLEAMWNTNNNTRLSIHIFPNFKGMSLREQAMAMHTADIIISPHGGQLANLAFIRRCTAVVELFPLGYYLHFFQPYVVVAGGISFDGYPFDRDQLSDTRKSTQSYDVRKQRRSAPMLASAASVVQAFPNVVRSVLSCRRGVDV